MNKLSTFIAGLLFSGQVLAITQGYAVASAHPLATQAGLDILAQGGNAFDAAIAVSSVLGVVAPYHSGLGGGGFWLLHLAKDGKDWVLDSRETAPLKAHNAMFLDEKGQPVPGLSLNGGLSAAIPGEPAAMAYLSSHYGKLPLSKVLAPAIKLAEEGFQLDEQFISFLAMPDRLQQIKRFPGSVQALLPEGQLPRPGDRLLQKDLAYTLKLLAQKGQAGFYQGEIAEKLVAGVNQAGGIWTLDDLKNYKIKIRQPLKSIFHGMTVITVPPPSAGGVALITMLNILENYPLVSMDNLSKVHTIIEAMRLTYWQRAEYLGDPDFVEMPLAKLISKENASYLKSLIKLDKALPSKKLPIHSTIKEKSHNTTHFSILDSEGNRVAATLTVNYIFGSAVVAPGTGVFLNDEMDDFSIKPGVENVFGVVGSDKNSIQPGKRPLSSITPAFLIKEGRLAILGTPGGSRIPTMVLLAALKFYEGFGAITMVSTMRFHHQYLPDIVQFEPETWSKTLQKGLMSMGYQLVPLKNYYGDMQAITIDDHLGVITAASDPRHIGMAYAETGTSSGYGVNY